MKPLTGPHGDKACLVFENNIMMYKNTPSQAGSEAFLVWYIKNMKAYWEQNLLSGLPVLSRSSRCPGSRRDQQGQGDQGLAARRQDLRAQGTELSPALAQVDGGQPLQPFTQTILGGKRPKTALKTLQQRLEHAS